MRTLEIGTRKHTEVRVHDEPSQGNANHAYTVNRVVPVEGGEGYLARIDFQNGPVKEFGVNGVHNEDLIVIVIDRMRSFQSGDYACLDNADAICFLKAALASLRHRTNEREARGVEGTNEK